MPIFLLMVAGAMLTGGFALLDAAKEEAAREESLRRQEFERRLLERELLVDDLRAEASRRGLDPTLVVDGYRGLRSGRLEIEDVVQFLHGR